MIKILIGISGKAYSGKSTLAKMLVEEFDFQEFSLAEELKENLIKYFDIPREELFGKKTTRSRKIAQQLGIFMREEIDKDYWVEKLFDKIFYRFNENVVIADIRFMNEASFIKKAWGILIRVERPNTKIEIGENHISEIDLDSYKDWDKVIYNNGSLDELHLKLSDFMYEMEEKWT